MTSEREAQRPLWTVLSGETQLDALRREYGAQRHPWLLLQALRYCREHNEPPPDWVIAELEHAPDMDASHRAQRGGKSPSERSRQDHIDFIRHLTVSLLRANGVPYREVFQAAADELADEPLFAGSDTAMRNSYRRAQRRETGRQ